MNVLSWLDPGPAGSGVALNSAAQVAAVALIAAFLARAAFRRSAAARHGVWLLALFAALASPAVALLTRGSGATTVTLPGRWSLESNADLRPENLSTVRPAAKFPTSDPPPTPRDGPGLTRDETKVARVATLDDPNQRATLPARVTAGPPARSETGRPVAGALVAAWLAGMVFLLARLAFGWLSLGRLVRGARPVEPARLAGTLDDVRRRLGGARDLPPILSAHGSLGPFSTGPFRPAVLVPEGLLDESRRADLVDVLVHECAHVMRRDHWIGLLQRVAGAIFWPHPAIHLINRRLTRAREEVCDDHVLVGGDARTYARTLLRLSLEQGGRRSSMAFGLLDRGWKLEDRVVGLLDARRVTMTRMRAGSFLAVGAVLLAAGVAVAGARVGADAQEGALAATPPEPPDPTRDRFEGVVVDEAGKPVAGARVNVPGNFRRPADFVTGRDGAFAFNMGAAKARYATVLATSADGAMQAIERRDGESSASPTATFRLTLRPARSLTVRVRDGEGRPVSGAVVEVLDMYVPLAQSETDETGVARFLVPADMKLCWALALKAGVGFDYAENFKSWPPGGLDVALPDAVDLTLDGARTIRVKAVDSAGAPVAGLAFVPSTIKKPGKLSYVNLTGSTAARVPTDAEGVATFAWAPRAFEQALDFSTYSETHQLRERVTVQADDDHGDLSATLLKKANLAGRVTGADGAPVAGVLIQAEGRGNTPDYGRVFARTAADGFYSVVVPPLQHYIVAVIDESRAASSRTGVVVKEGEARNGLDFGLVPGTVLRGRVTLGPDRRPDAGAAVTLIEQGAPIPVPTARGQIISHSGVEELVRWTGTDAEGRYRLPVGPGTYRLSGPESGAPLSVTVHDEAFVENDFTRDREAGIVLTGVVEGPDGRPISASVRGASVVGRGHAGVQVLTDDQGRFRAERSNDAMVLDAKSVDGRLAGTATIEPDQAEVTIKLSPAGGVRGRVVDAEGRPLKRLTLHCGPERPANEVPRGVAMYTALTDDQGRYEFLGLRVGSHGRVFTMTEGLRSFDHVYSVAGPTTVELPDLVVPAEPRKAP